MRKRRNRNIEASCLSNSRAHQAHVGHVHVASRGGKRGLSNKPIFPQPLCLSKQPLSEEPEAHVSGACLLPANGGEWRTAIGYWKTLGVAVNYFHSHSFNFSCSQTARRNHPPTLRLRLSRSRLVRHGRSCTPADRLHAERRLESSFR